MCHPPEGSLCLRIFFGDLMLVRINSMAINGIEAQTICLEVDSSPGLPGFSMVGLPDSAVRESRERVISALRHCGFAPLRNRITVNFAPAYMRKEGSTHDLALALGLLAATEQIPLPCQQAVFLGELGLDGAILPIRGALCVAAAMSRLKFNTLFLPRANAWEAAVVKSTAIIPLQNLHQTAGILRREMELPGLSPEDFGVENSTHARHPDFAQLRGQLPLKRALLVAAAGNHNFLLSGSPGSGKTLAAKCFPALLGPLQHQEALEATMIYSSAGLLEPGQGLLKERPFRCPHHSASLPSLVGGGSPPRPGEVSLAHGGVLFLDELPEFGRAVLETLRQPLEDGRVTLARARGSRQYPAKFLLGAAMNPCPCGFYMDNMRVCSCTTRQVEAYRARISGPLLDRIDLRIEVGVPSADCWEEGQSEMDTASMLEQVMQARKRQSRRHSQNKDNGEFCSNANLEAGLAEKVCELDSAGREFLKNAYTKAALSPRGRERVLRVARTIADLEDANKVEVIHLAEALQYKLAQKNI